MNRREWLARTTVLALATVSGTKAAAGNAAAGLLPQQRLVTTRRIEQRFEVVILNGEGAVCARCPLPGRGHSFAIDPTGNHLIAFGRQPGFYATVMQASTLKLHHTLTPAANRHFFGHGAFNPDGTVFYATENDYANGEGVLGVYAIDARGHITRSGEWSTHGIGPHEVILLNDKRTLCVANGGLLTHPDYGKHPLNLADMCPSLVYLDATTGQLLEKHVLPEHVHQLSIRHLVQDGQGRVWIGCQYMGSQTDDVPLVGVHTPGRHLDMLLGPDHLRRSLKHYIGSMAATPDGQQIASSSPVGGRVVLWNTTDLSIVNSVSFNDGCGVAGLATGTFMASNGAGALSMLSSTGHTPLIHAQDTAWDNHIRVV